jgi:hypothetical protein
VLADQLAQKISIIARACISKEWRTSIIMSNRFSGSMTTIAIAAAASAVCWWRRAIYPSHHRNSNL